MKDEERIKDALNEITEGQVREVSLIYELGDYLKMERERDKKIKEISKLKAKRMKVIKAGSNSKKLKAVNSKLRRALVELVKKVIEMHVFKNKFNANPTAFYKSRRLFVTFSNFQVARSFKDLYNKQYRDSGIPFVSPKVLSRLSSKVDGLSKKNDPLPERSSSGKLQRNQEKYVGVEQKVKYRGSTVDENVKEKFAELVEKQKRFEEKEKVEKNEQFYSERPKNFDTKVQKELKRGILSKMAAFYLRSPTSEDVLKMNKMREVFGPHLVLKRSLDPKYINWDYHSDSELGLVEMVLYSLGVLVVMPAICFFLNYQYFKLDLM